ncbi:hypothetical protein AVEN_189509-1, partial [Araneus ventricosus]
SLICFKRPGFSVDSGRTERGQVHFHRPLAVQAEAGRLRHPLRLLPPHRVLGGGLRGEGRPRQNHAHLQLQRQTGTRKTREVR